MKKNKPHHIVRLFFWLLGTLIFGVLVGLWLFFLFIYGFFRLK